MNMKYLPTDGMKRVCKEAVLSVDPLWFSNIDKFSQQESSVQRHQIHFSPPPPLLFSLDNTGVQPAAVHAGESSLSQSTRLPVPAQ